MVMIVIESLPSLKNVCDHLEAEKKQTHTHTKTQECLRPFGGQKNTHTHTHTHKNTKEKRNPYLKYGEQTSDHGFPLYLHQGRQKTTLCLKGDDMPELM
jgi:hypothetical protein